KRLAVRHLELEQLGRHAVVVAAVKLPDQRGLLMSAPGDPTDAYVVAPRYEAVELALRQRDFYRFINGVLYALNFLEQQLFCMLARDGFALTNRRVGVPADRSPADRPDGRRAEI